VPYNSNVNSLFSYGAGQPKGAGWPTITPSNPKQSTPYVAQIPGLWND